MSAFGKDDRFSRIESRVRRLESMVKTGNGGSYVPVRKRT